MVVENRPGASGQLAVQHLMASPPDGHVVMFMSAGTTITSARRNAPFDVRKDVTPISATAAGPLAIYVSVSQPIRTVADIIRLAKANPGKLNYTSPGVGSLQNMLFELLKQRTGIDMVHIPFKSASESTAAILSGRVEVGMDSMLLLKPQVDSGRLRFEWAVTSPPPAACRAWPNPAWRITTSSVGPASARRRARRAAPSIRSTPP